MKKFNYMMFGTLLGLTLIGLIVIAYIPEMIGERLNNQRNTELNRAYQHLTAGEITPNPDISAYPGLEQAAYLTAERSPRELREFFEDDPETVIRPVFQGNRLDGYLKFTLVSREQTYIQQFRWWTGIILTAALILFGGFFVYIRLRILKPFVQISLMPGDLARGNLTAAIPETGDRYFGKFVWSLNLLKESLEEHKQRELALQKEKKTLLLSLSHDIKTPLSAIKLYLRALRENFYQDPQKQVHIYTRIEHQADAIESFTNDIIKSAREEILDIRINPGEFYLSELTGRLGSYYSDKLALLKINFILTAGEDCLLYGDLDRAEEVFQNLIENAIKYGDGREIRLFSAREEDCLLLTVANSGNTLPEPEMIHIFDSFYRGSNAGSQRGSGLGLYICRQIMTAMEGDIFSAAKDGDLCMTAVLKIV